jgi:hypothetical protein
MGAQSREPFGVILDCRMLGAMTHCGRASFHPKSRSDDSCLPRHQATIPRFASPYDGLPSPSK